jgi:hypothetical protein
MRRVWMVVALAVALLAFYPAWTGRTGWWYFGMALTVFAILLLEPWLLTWEIRRRGDGLQITDEGVLRRLARGGSEYVRWSELREVSVVVRQDAASNQDYFYVLAGSGRNGVLIGQAMAAQHDLLSHLAKLPGFDPRGVPVMSESPADPANPLRTQRYVLWQAKPLEGMASVVPGNHLEHRPPPPTLH